MKAQPKSLAAGAVLDASTFQDFVNRMRFHCKGEGLQEHGTANAVFEVQELQRLTGLDPNFTEDLVVIHEDSKWWSFESFLKDAVESGDDGFLGELQDLAQKTYKKDFEACSEEQQHSLVEDLSDITITGYMEQWVHIGTHLTPEAAQAFIDRKGHNYGELRISVEGCPYSNELNAIRDAIMAGQLVFVDRTLA